MVRAWYLADSWKDSDPRNPHMPDPQAFVGLEEINKKTRVEYFTFPAEGLETDEVYKTLKKERQYTYEDVVNISTDTLHYEEKRKNFFTEHIHTDEEIRFIEAGSGYFDIRDIDNKWIRVEVVKDDLLIVPAGIFHRFTLGTGNYASIRRLFVGEPVWTPINRPGADEHPVRKAYELSMAAAKA